MSKRNLQTWEAAARRRRALTLLELVVVLLVLAVVAGIAAPQFTGVNTQAAGTATLKSLRTLQSVILSTYVPNMNGADISAGSYTLAGLSSPVIDSATESMNPVPGLPRGARIALTHVDMQPMLVWLFQNPASLYGHFATNTITFNQTAGTSGLGWNGPYLSSGMGNYPGANPNPATRGFAAGTFGNYGDPTVLDGWGNPIVIVYVTDQTGQSYYILLSAGSAGTLNLTTNSDGTVHITFNSDPTTNPTGSIVTAVGGAAYQYWMPLR